MIAANKRLLKATLTEGVLGIQINLIQLYQSNLSAVATQSALIAGFSFTAISSAFTASSLFSRVLSYFYYACFTVCFCAALFALSQATICVMFGPSMALKSDDSDAVRQASEMMRQQQKLVFSIGVVSISALFLGACILAWATYPIPIAAVCCFFYVLGYSIVVSEGSKAYKTFNSKEDVTVDEKLVNSTSKHIGGIVGFLESAMGIYSAKEADASASETELANNAAGNDGKSEGGKSAMSSASVLQNNDPTERIKLKAKGIIWRRKALEKGGTFIKVFAVLEKGKVDFYESEQHYINHENPINPQPVKLWQQNLETDPRKFARSVTSLRNTMKSALLGNEDFYVADLVKSEYDLVYASRNFKFALLPKVSSELVATEITELLAHDEKSYKQWVRA